MIFTIEEKNLFRYILPVQGNILTLELVENIIRKLDSNIIDENIIFSDDEWKLIKIAIEIKDHNGVIPYECLNIVRKLLKGEF